MKRHSTNLSGGKHHSTITTTTSTLAPKRTVKVVKPIQAPPSPPSSPHYSSHITPINPQEVQQVLKRAGLRPAANATVGDADIRFKCPHPPRHTSTSSGRINMTTGAYRCIECRKSGKWPDLLHLLRSHTPQHASLSGPSLHSSRSTVPPANKLSGSPNTWIQELAHPTRPDTVALREWCLRPANQGGWGMEERTLERYGIGVAWLDAPAKAVETSPPSTTEGDEVGDAPNIPSPPRQLYLTFPRSRWVVDEKGDHPPMTLEAAPTTSMVSFRVVPWSVEMESVSSPTSTLDPNTIQSNPGYDDARAFFYPSHQNRASSPPGLFGSTSTPSPPPALDTSEGPRIIITAREEDAMAIWQTTGVDTISLPTLSYQLPLEALPLLERYTHVTLWLGTDAHGRAAASMFARKLGIQRCWLVGGHGGSEEASIQGAWSIFRERGGGRIIKEALAQARRLAHQQILSFSQLREAVWREVENPEQVRGIQSQSLPSLNAILKGHRPGELTIITGGTGVGKTTVVSQLSLDYCAYGGISTLWGSFEISNVRLAKRMLYQYAGTDLSGSPDHFVEWADRFEALPLYFLKFFGSTQVDAVIDAMSHAIYAHDVQHVVIDNLQFMTSGQGKGWERWEVQDEALSALRRFATEHNVHVTLVVHPRKDDRDVLEINSIFGSAKTTQEADNVIILQNGPAFRYLDIRKNRFDGQLGVIPYRFDAAAQKVLEMSKDEVRAADKAAPPPSSPPSSQRYNQSQSYSKPTSRPTRSAPSSPPQSSPIPPRRF